ncbi:MAG TPA: FAD-dependent oxidoreductase, partial [Pyrinomonadaceae bacterium]
ATRDREQLAGLDVCVVGGGDAAAENALLLAEVCPTVTLVHRGRRLGARSEFVERIAGDHRINVFTEARLVRIIGRERVEAVEVMRDGGIKPFQMAAGGVLIRVGVEPNTELFAGQAQLDERGYFVVSSAQETSVEQVFAVGDVSNPLAPTISGAVGAGATAAKTIAARLTAASR